MHQGENPSKHGANQPKVGESPLPSGTDATYREALLGVAGGMYRTALALTHNPMEAEDLVQDAFERLWTNRQRLRLDERLDAYAARTVHNLFIDRQRRNHLHLVGQAADELQLATDSPEGESDFAEERYRMVMEAIAQLPDKWQRIITMKDIEGRSYEDISRLTGFSQMNVRVLLSRARKRVRKICMQNIEDDASKRR